MIRCYTYIRRRFSRRTSRSNHSACRSDHVGRSDVGRFDTPSGTDRNGSGLVLASAAAPETESVYDGGCGGPNGIGLDSRSSFSSLVSRLDDEYARFCCILNAHLATWKLARDACTDMRMFLIWVILWCMSSECVKGMCVEKCVSFRHHVALSAWKWLRTSQSIRAFPPLYQ